MLYLPPVCDSALLGNAELPLNHHRRRVQNTGALAIGKVRCTKRPRFLPVGISGVFNWRRTLGKATAPNGQRLNVEGPIIDLASER